MTKNEQYRRLIDGTHCMSNTPGDGLRDYWTVQAVKGAARVKDAVERLMAIRKAVKNYRVMVNLTEDERVRIFNPESKDEVLI